MRFNTGPLLSADHWDSFADFVQIYAMVNYFEIFGNRICANAVQTNGKTGNDIDAIDCSNLILKWDQCTFLHCHCGLQQLSRCQRKLPNKWQTTNPNCTRQTVDYIQSYRSTTIWHSYYALHAITVLFAAFGTLEIRREIGIWWKKDMFVMRTRSLFKTVFYRLYFNESRASLPLFV